MIYVDSMKRDELHPICHSHLVEKSFLKVGNESVPENQSQTGLV